MATITELFRSAGYFTCNDNGTGRPGKQDFNFLLPSDRPAFDGVRWEERAPGQPFFAQVNLGEPHRRFRRNAAAPTDAAAVTLPSYYPPGSLAKQDWALYLDTVHLLDRRVGEVLQRLDAAGLTTSTIVFFFADNGRGHFRDKQFLYDGGVHVPLIVRWPEHLPAGTTQDRLVSLLDVVHDSLRVASITPAPSMDNAGQAFLDLPQESPPRRDAVYASRDRCDETLERMRMVRTASHSYIRNFRTDLPYLQPNRYKFGEYPVWRQMLQLQTDRKLTGPVANFAATVKPVEELYDLKNDPDEVHNLAADPAYAATLGEMRIRMARWLDRDGDDGAIPEPPDTSQKMTEFYNGRYGPVKLWTVEGAETYP